MKPTIRLSMLCGFAFFNMTNSCSAQLMGGGGMGGMGSSNPLEVVILLGSDYDYQAPPFVGATEVVEAFRTEDVQKGIYFPHWPTLGSVRVDVTSEIPESGSRTIVATHPKALEGKALEDFKTAIKLTALRFGTISIEYVPVEKQDDTVSSVWLREPFHSADQLSKKAKDLYEIAAALATKPDGSVAKARLDLFEAPRPAVSGGGMGMMDMGMGMDEMMGMEMDDMGMDMGMGMDEPASVEELEKSIVENRDQLRRLQEKIEEKRQEYRSAERSKLEAIRQQLSKLVDQEIEVQQDRHQIEVELLDRKISRLRRAISKQKRQRSTRINQRLQELLSEEPRPN